MSLKPFIALLFRPARFAHLAALASLLGALVGCGSSRDAMPSAYAGSRIAGLECAPFARELSGIALYGDAADWWEQAGGRYRRAATPVVGSVLVFRRSDRLPSGHVSVVSSVLGPRQIQVIQANWVRNQLDEDQLVVDVSDANDWSAVRVWYPPVAQLGAHAYDTFGFILPPWHATHDGLARASHPAAIIAVNGRQGRPTPRRRDDGG